MRRRAASPRGVRVVTPRVPTPASGALTEGHARALTDEVKADAAALWAKLLALYEGGAHSVLGYSSWADYAREEFGYSKSHAYRLIDAARVVSELQSPVGDSASERVVRELAPLRAEPDRLREAWADAVEEHGPAPTAAQVREIVRAPTATPAVVPVDQCVVPPELQAALRSEFAIVGKAAVRHGGVYVGSELQGGARWVNPPAREVKRWVRAASDYADFDNCVAVCVVPVATTATWWWDYCRRAEVRFLREPLAWDQAGETLAPVAAAVVVFGARRASVRWWDLSRSAAQEETPERARVADNEGDDEPGSGSADGADAELARVTAKFPGFDA